ncbi:hypothetical protein BURK1_01692 [Burkholderiales bacterium]|nr:hypothetical protein BURK1_01692 [Burkholderiales bacterium]
MADPADLNLDELKRRGRRRLIGAVVLALVAAIVVPMLLESEPRPLGEDVSVRIPPVDEGKFVTGLGDARPQPEPAKTAPSVSPPSAPAVAAPEPPVAAGGAAPAASAGQDAAARRSLADAEKSVLSPGARAGAAEPVPEAATATKAAAAPARADATPKAEPARNGFVVQLAAFSDDKGANALGNRLRRAGYAAYTESLTTSRGTLWRVRVGPYPSREAAAQARDRLKGEGHAGIVVPAK